jgi:hypothetical protein
MCAEKISMGCAPPAPESVRGWRLGMRDADRHHQAGADRPPTHPSSPRNHAAAVDSIDQDGPALR